MTGSQLRTDIEVGYGGMRMCWEAVSERGRAWADRHPDWLRDAREGAEIGRSHGDPLITRALIAGLVVRCGDADVTLC